MKRFASHYGAVLVPDMVSDKIALFVGIPENGESYTVNPYQYNLVKKVDEYLNVKGNRWPDALETDFTVFQIWDYRIYRAGNRIQFNGIPLIVQSVVRILQDGILKNQYELRPKKGMRGLELFNEEIVGASVTGQVTDISRDRVMVQLEIDEADIVE